MGYDLHITRAEDWPQSEQNPITLEEWLAVVEEDPELAPWDAYPNSHFALWSGDSKHEHPWMDWSRGKIYSKNPDAPLIRKMVSIARRLNARVIGQESEVYNGSEEGIDFDRLLNRNA
jgi:hypothetical protein